MQPGPLGTRACSGDWAPEPRSGRRGTMPRLAVAWGVGGRSSPMGLAGLTGGPGCWGGAPEAQASGVLGFGLGVQSCRSSGRQPGGSQPGVRWGALAWPGHPQTSSLHLMGVEDQGTPIAPASASLGVSARGHSEGSRPPAGRVALPGLALSGRGTHSCLLRPQPPRPVPAREPCTEQKLALSRGSCLWLPLLWLSKAWS